MKDAGDPLYRIKAGGSALSFDAHVGNLRHVTLQDGARALVPLHTAHWVGGEVPEGVPPVERHLSGDFFCAPFGHSGDVDVPPHGWTANSPWQVTRADAGRLEATLVRDVQGARVHKRLHLVDGAPLLLQEHVIAGGAGPLTVTHHPMVHVAGRGRMSCSPKRVFLTPDAPLEPAHALAYPARAADPHAFPGREGPVDLHALPVGDGTEDFITAVEQGAGLGWTAIVREVEDDVVFVLKHARVLPVTMFWHSNGGRAYAPWDGVHRGVVGIEDGCTAGVATPERAAQPNVVSQEGVATHLPLGSRVTHRIAHVIGAIARPEGWTEVTDIACAGGALVLTGDAGAPRTLPFDIGFLTEEARHGGC